MRQLLAPVNTHAMQKSCLRLVHDRHQMLNSADRANGNEDKRVIVEFMVTIIKSKLV